MYRAENAEKSRYKDLRGNAEIRVPILRRDKPPRGFYDEQLAIRVRYFKESEKGREHMCKIFEDVAKEAVQADRQKRNRISVQEMLNDGMVVEKIAKYLHITVGEVEEYAKQRWLSHRPY